MRNLFILAILVLLSFDPVVASTFLGGQVDDEGRVIALDSSGNVYVAGSTASTDFPITPGAYDNTYTGGYPYYTDIFVSKLDGNLTTLLSSTFLRDDMGYRLKVKSMIVGPTGNVYLAGEYFIAKLDSRLTTLVVSPFLPLALGVNSIAIDSNGNVYAVGNDYGAHDSRCVRLGSSDPFSDTGIDSLIYKLDGDLTNVLACAILTGSGDDVSYAIGLEKSGNVYVAGETLSPDFPATPGSYDPAYIWDEAFVSKLDSNLTTLLASTFLGGHYDDRATSLAIDSFGNVYVAGNTLSDDFPVTPGAYDTYSDYGGFVSKLDRDLKSLLASTFINAYGYSLSSFALDSSGNVYVGGNDGHDDSEVRKLDGNLTTLVGYLTASLSAGDSDWVNAITVDSSGNVYATGMTYSWNFPITSDAYDTTYNGNGDAYVSRLEFPDAITLLSPNGGEAIPSGSIYNVRWSAIPLCARFDLLYSMNNGLTWKPLAKSITGTNYDWTVPVPANNKKKCLIKVIGYSVAGAKIGEDTSDSPFMIEVLKVISPDGGEVLISGTPLTLMWRTNETINPVTKVELYYTTGGGIWKLINLRNIDTGSYHWTVPYVSADTRKCKVKVVLKDAGGKIVGTDTSDSCFTMLY